jgi:hypothetical protein
MPTAGYAYAPLTRLRSLPPQASLPPFGSSTKQNLEAINIMNAEQEKAQIAVPTQMRYKIISQCVGAIHELPLRVCLT